MRGAAGCLHPQQVAREVDTLDRIVGSSGRTTRTLLDPRRFRSYPLILIFTARGYDRLGRRGGEMYRFVFA